MRRLVQMTAAIVATAGLAACADSIAGTSTVGSGRSTAATATTTTSSTMTTTTAPARASASSSVSPLANAVIYPPLPAGAQGAMAQEYAMSCLDRPVVALDRQQLCDELMQQANAPTMTMSTTRSNAQTASTGTSAGLVFKR